MNIGKARPSRRRQVHGAAVLCATESEPNRLAKALQKKEQEDLEKMMLETAEVGVRSMVRHFFTLKTAAG